jgi:hypothetical protein
MVLIHDVHALGAAFAVVGAALLVVHVPVMARLLWPIRTAGAMPLTLYSAHVLVLVPGVLEHDPVVLFLALVDGGLLFEVLWRALARQQEGPLEWLVGAASRSAYLGDVAVAEMFPGAAFPGGGGPGHPAGKGGAGR